MSEAATPLAHAHGGAAVGSAGAAAPVRVELGGGLVLGFETAGSLAAAVAEASRRHRGGDPSGAASVAADLAALASGPAGLNAVLYLEATDWEELAALANRLAGVEDCVALEIDGASVPGRPQAVPAAEGGADAPDAESALAPAHHLCFRLDPGARGAWSRGAAVAVRVHHTAHERRVELTAEQRDALAAEL